MKRILMTVIMMTSLMIAVNATVLFPHFVDIAPDYEEGSTPELTASGIDCAIYHSTKPGFMASNFTEVETFFKDTLPSDVERMESKSGDNILVTYTYVSKKKEAVDTGCLKSTIYVLKRPDNSFVAAYCEKRIE